MIVGECRHIRRGECRVSSFGLFRRLSLHTDHQRHLCFEPHYEPHSEMFKFLHLSQQDSSEADIVLWDVLSRDLHDLETHLTLIFFPNSTCTTSIPSSVHWSSDWVEQDSIRLREELNMKLSASCHVRYEQEGRQHAVLARSPEWQPNYMVRLTVSPKLLMRHISTPCILLHGSLNTMGLMGLVCGPLIYSGALVRRSSEIRRTYPDHPPSADALGSHPNLERIHHFYYVFILSEMKIII